MQSIRAPWLFVWPRDDKQYPNIRNASSYVLNIDLQYSMLYVWVCALYLHRHFVIIAPDAAAAAYAYAYATIRDSVIYSVAKLMTH